MAIASDTASEQLIQGFPLCQRKPYCRSMASPGVPRQLPSEDPSDLEIRGTVFLMALNPKSLPSHHLTWATARVSVAFNLNEDNRSGSKRIRIARLNLNVIYQSLYIQSIFSRRREEKKLLNVRYLFPLPCQLHTTRLSSNVALDSTQWTARQ